MEARTSFRSATAAVSPSLRTLPHDNHASPFVPEVVPPCRSSHDYATVLKGSHPEDDCPELIHDWALPAIALAPAIVKPPPLRPGPPERGSADALH